MKLRFIISLLALTLSFSQLSAQRKNKAYLDYIEKYSSLAVKHQKQYGIPASITLAQGLLESGAGRSELARMSNNHFGIKCHSDWKGKRVYYDDDKKDEETAEEETYDYLGKPFASDKAKLATMTLYYETDDYAIYGLEETGEVGMLLFSN